MCMEYRMTKSSNKSDHMELVNRMQTYRILELSKSFSMIIYSMK